MPDAGLRIMLILSSNLMSGHQTRKLRVRKDDKGAKLGSIYSKMF